MNWRHRQNLRRDLGWIMIFGIVRRMGHRGCLMPSSRGGWWLYIGIGIHRKRLWFCGEGYAGISLMRKEKGFESSLFSSVQFEPELKSRVLQEILSPEFGGKLPKKLLPRLVFKFQRWKGNAWKHELCYKESMWSVFWSGVWNHLLKPRRIWGFWGQSGQNFRCSRLELGLWNHPTPRQLSVDTQCTGAGELMDRHRHMLSSGMMGRLMLP